MSDVRHDPVTGRVVIMAAERATRPHTLARPDRDEDRGPEHCPFCPGHESMTPPEVMRTGDGVAGEPGWRVRVFPNLYPITEAHEVVVFSPDHSRTFGDLSDIAAAEVFTVLRDRVRVHLDAGLPFATAFINQGRAAGASIAHPHAQIFGLDFVPPEVAAAIDRQLAALDNLLADDIAGARDRDLLIGDGEVAVWCPVASTSPLLLRVCHTDFDATFDGASDAEITSIAIATRDALAAIDRAVEHAPYNVVVHSAPGWYVEITPRLTLIAGVEQATGVFVNTIPPELASEYLRAGAE